MRIIYYFMRVIGAILNNGYITATDFAGFLNCLFGTNSITAKKINQILLQKQYMFEAYKRIILDGKEVCSRYIPNDAVREFSQIAVANNTGETFLKWKPKILLDYMCVNLSYDIDIKRMCLEILYKATSHQLISYNECQFEVLEKNFKYLIKILNELNVKEISNEGNL